MKKEKLDKLMGYGIMKDADSNPSIEEAREKLNNILYKTIFRKTNISEEEIDLYVIEDMLRKVRNKYNIRISYIMPMKGDEKNNFALHWSFSVSQNNELVTNIFARNIYEGMAKCLIRIYYQIKGVEK